MSEAVIRTRDLTKEFVRDEFHVIALKNANIEIHKGEFVALMGPSGSGKSTLLHLIAAMDRPTDGEILVLGENLRALSDREIAHWRNVHIGFVFQSFNLIPRTTALANVELPLTYAGVPSKQRRARALAALEMVGLSSRAGHLPSEMSGGQQQRVAVARAIATNPALILADEPTGNLDSHSSEELMRIFDELNQAGRTIVIITHEPEIAAHTRRTVRVKDGLILSDEVKGQPKPSTDPVGTRQ